MTDSKPRRRRPASKPSADDWRAAVESLSYREAQTALELAMARLQSSELEVEEMADLYRRAEAYAERCQAVLAGVEQQVIEWDASSA